MSEFLLSLKVEIAVVLLSSIALPVAKWIHNYIISDYVIVKHERDTAIDDIESLRLAEQRYNHLLNRHTGRSYKNHVRNAVRIKVKRSLSDKFTLSRIRSR